MVSMNLLGQTKELKLRVRVSTTCYRTKTGIDYKRSVYFYKTPNPEHLVECFYDSLSMTDGHGILNLEEVLDGVYSLEVCNLSRDVESGYIDDWDYQLIPWEKINESH